MTTGRIFDISLVENSINQSTKYYCCERSELLICKVHQFGLGCIKNCASWPFRIGRMFHSGIVTDGTSLIDSGQPHTSHLAPLTFAMAERTRDGEVEECKGFSPPNVPTTNASSTRLPLGSLDLSTRVPNTVVKRIHCTLCVHASSYVL